MPDSTSGTKNLASLLIDEYYPLDEYRHTCMVFFPAFLSNQFIASRGKKRVLSWAVERLRYFHRNKKLAGTHAELLVFIYYSQEEQIRFSVEWSSRTQEQAARLPVSLQQDRIRTVSRQGPAIIVIRSILNNACTQITEMLALMCQVRCSMTLG